ncbi:MAG: prepilin-type N-terminal cleavage/methylation domain-containing protein [Candidatus Omnitrophota bacterium]
MAKGFTLVEIIVVIIILGTLGTIAVPRLAQQQESARAGEAVQLLDMLHRSQDRWAIEHPEGGLTDCASLDVTPRVGNFSPPVCSDTRIDLTRQGGSYTISVDPSGCYFCSGNCPGTLAKTLPVGPGCERITIVTATFGGNCGVAAGNVTTSVAGLCDGTKSCSFIESGPFCGGGFFPDPVVGCYKDFSVNYVCSGGVGKSAYAPAHQCEGDMVALACP